MTNEDKPREYWIDFAQDADVMIETEDEGDIVVEAFHAFDYAVNEDAIRFIEYSAFQKVVAERDFQKFRAERKNDEATFAEDEREELKSIAGKHIDLAADWSRKYTLATEDRDQLKIELASEIKERQMWAKNCAILNDASKELDARLTLIEELEDALKYYANHILLADGGDVARAALTRINEFRKAGK